MHARLAVLVAVCVLVVPSCFSDAYGHARHELHVRALPQPDAIEAIELCYGIDLGGSEAAATLRAELAGARIFPAYKPWIALDFDGIRDEGRKLPEAERTKVLRDWLELEPGVRVTETTFFEDERGRIGLLRRWEIARASAFVPVIDAFLVETQRKRTVDFRSPEFPVFDEETAALMNRRSADGSGYVRMEDGRLVLDLPMSGHSAARALEAIGQGKLEEQGWHVFLVGTSDLRVADGRVLLAYAWPDDGWLRFVGPEDGGSGDSDLKKELRAPGFGFQFLDAAAVERRIGRGP